MTPLIEKYVKFTKKWEGGLSKDKSDSASSYPCPTPFAGKTGFHTNAGITYTTWVSFFGKDNDARFYTMNSTDWFEVFKSGYWNGVKGDSYNSQNIAIFVTGMAWGSGVKQASKSLQVAINHCGLLCNVDGIIGNKTINLANAIEPRKLFDALVEERRRFFYVIGVGKNAKFLNGWLNRLRDYQKTFTP
jgi:lysozyme family protein